METRYAERSLGACALVTSPLAAFSDGPRSWFAWRRLGLIIMGALMLLGPMAVLSMRHAGVQAATPGDAAIGERQQNSQSVPPGRSLRDVVKHLVLASSTATEPARLPHIPFSRLRGLTHVAELAGGTLSAGTAGNTVGNHFGTAAILILGLAGFRQLSRHAGRLHWSTHVDVFARSCTSRMRGHHTP